MKLEEARELLASLTPAQRAALEDAHWRYMAFAGVSFVDDAGARQAAADRLAYPHLLLAPNGAGPCLSDKLCAAFMHGITGLPEQWCLAYDKCDFCDLHGDDYEETMAQLGHV